MTTNNNNANTNSKVVTINHKRTNEHSIISDDEFYKNGESIETSPDAKKNQIKN
jgi:hypothetical protein